MSSRCTWHFKRSFFGTLLLFCIVSFYSTSTFAGLNDGGQDRPLPRPRPDDSYDDEGGDAEEASLLHACTLLKNGPSGQPFDRDGYVKESWAWVESNKRIYRAGFSTSRNYPFTNPLCEQFNLNKISQAGGRGAVVRRCESIKTEIYLQYSELSRSGGQGQSGGASAGGFGDLGSLLDSGSGETDMTERCEDPTTEDSFACAYLGFRKKLDDDVGQRAAARTILNACRGYGANMSPDLSWETQNSYMNGGIDRFGGGCFGGYYNRGGPIIIKQQNKWYDTVGNVVLGLAKVGLPTYAMWDANRRHESNARAAMDYNFQLGFPSIVTAGGGVGGMYGHGGQGGMGGGGGHYSGGMGGSIYGGAAYSGYGGGCPYGACYGNGGQVVGGTGIPWAGGAYGGGMCGQAPYAPWYGGCGGGGNGGVGFYGPGGYYGGMNNGMQGGGYGMYPYGSNGIYGPWSAGGMPGPYGTAGGGTGWGPNGGFTGYQGAPGQYGASAPFNAQTAQMQAQMYSAYAAQMARQAQQQAQAAKLYQGTLDDMEKVQEKSYQAYYAYQMAQMGMSYPGMTGFGGSTLSSTGSAGMGGGGYYFGGYSPGSLNSGGVYYPPYPSNRPGLSISGSVNYQR